jgi:hypothetical protein
VQPATAAWPYGFPLYSLFADYTVIGWGMVEEGLKRPCRLIGVNTGKNENPYCSSF